MKIFWSSINKYEKCLIVIFPVGFIILLFSSIFIQRDMQSAFNAFAAFALTSIYLGLLYERTFISDRVENLLRHIPLRAEFLQDARTMFEKASTVIRQDAGKIAIGGTLAEIKATHFFMADDICRNTDEEMDYLTAIARVCLEHDHIYRLLINSTN